MSQCKLPGCDKPIRYKSQGVCQMHYFRKMRTGSYHKKARQARSRISNPEGYISVYWPNHPLADVRGYTYEHRVVMYRLLGAGCGNCKMCGAPESWSTCHVDHIDEDITNNAASNLRVLCRGCNVARGFTQQSHKGRSDVGLIEFEGERKTATSWARDPRVKISRSTIMLRKRKGMSDYDALFSPKKTHRDRSEA